VFKINQARSHRYSQCWLDRKLLLSAWFSATLITFIGHDIHAGSIYRLIGDQRRQRCLLFCRRIFLLSQLSISASLIMKWSETSRDRTGNRLLPRDAKLLGSSSRRRCDRETQQGGSKGGSVLSRKRIELGDRALHPRAVYSTVDAPFSEHVRHQFIWLPRWLPSSHPLGHCIRNPESVPLILSSFADRHVSQRAFPRTTAEVRAEVTAEILWRAPRKSRGCYRAT